jgi:D-3-phosphoglycerate dehydrogenase / 2-oxoglutarate reductase
MQVLFIDSVHPLLEEKLTESGFICVDGTSLSHDEILQRSGIYEGVVIRSRFKLDQIFFEKNPQLKFVARAGAGMENIDTTSALSKGVICLNAPEGNRNAVAEQALGMLLALSNRLLIADREVRRGKWRREENRGHELDGKTVAIIGFGNTGSAFAKKLSGFEIRLLAFDPYVKISSSRFPYVEQCDMNDLFKSADVVSLHVPLTEETRGMVNEEYLNRFHKPITLINTSRGLVANSLALIKALKSGKIIGAALDVFDFEDVSFEKIDNTRISDELTELALMDQVILTPHIAGWTFESHLRISEVLAEKIISRFSASS